MTLGDIVADVRNLVNDTETPYRWSNDIMLGFLRDAIIRLNSVRPASRYDDKTGLLVDIEWPDDLSLYETPDSYNRWKQAFVYYAAARCLEMDAADTVNQSLAVDFMSKAEARFLV